ncbi:MAG: hypothetical protein Q9M36_13420 [Sulfurovum sp.]|nr:hypothetical protein [Sulfurovum sp.]
MQPASFTDSRDPAPSGGLIDYIVELQNNVPVEAINVELNVTVPIGFSFFSVNNPDITCVYNGATPSTGAVTDRVECTGATFPASGNYDINITLRAPYIETATVYTSTATVTSDVEVNDANNLEIVKTTIVKGADLNLTKTSNPTPVISSGIATYTFDLGNAGPHKALNTSMTDTLPVGLVFLADDASPASDDDSSWICTALGQDVSCVGPDIDVNATSTFSFRVRVESTVVGTVINAATVISDTLEVNPNDNTDTDELNITAGTDMTLDKTVDTSPAIAGQDVSFSLVVTNAGFMDAENITISDTLVAGYTNIRASGTGWDCNVSANPTITCDRTASPMGAGVSETINIIAEAPNVVSVETHENTATVLTSTDDPIPSNDTDTVSYILSPDEADLSLTKSKSPELVAIGETVISTIIVNNVGPRDASPVQVIDDLSTGESYLSYTGTDWNCTHDASITGGVVTCDYSLILLNGATAPTLTISTLIETKGDIVNRACTGGSAVGGVTSIEPLASDTNTDNNCQDGNITATGGGQWDKYNGYSGYKDDK